MDFPPSNPSQNSSGWGPILIVIIGGLFFIFLIIIIIIITRSHSKPSAPVSPTRSLHLYDNPIPVTSSQPGESTICSQDTRRRQWIVDKDGNGHCQCKFPFYGPDCTQEQVDPNYRDSGSISGYRTQPLYTSRVDNLSFGTGVNCSSLCDRSVGCQGFTYDGSTCSLIQGKVVYGGVGGSTDTSGSTTNLYLKRNVVPELESQIVVYSGTLPPRYWNVSNSSAEYQILDPNKIYRVNFYPTKVVGNSSLIGILSPQPLPSDLQTLNSYLTSPPANVSILNPNVPEVTIPTRWLPLPSPATLYLVFLPINK